MKIPILITIVLVAVSLFAILCLVLKTPVKIPEDVAALIVILEKKENVRGKGGRQYLDVEEAAKKLGAMGPKAVFAMRPLERLLYDKKILQESPVAREIVIALGNIGPKARAAAPRLRTLLGEIGSYGAPIANTSSYRVETVEALWKITHNRSFVIPYLAKMKGTVNDRQDGIRALGRIGVPALPTLIALLDDDDDTRREEAAKALGTISPTNSEVINALSETLLLQGERNGYLRSCAAISLGQIGTDAKAALPILKKRAFDQGDMHCANAVWMITNDPDETVPCLIAVLKKGVRYPSNIGTAGPPENPEPNNRFRIQAAELLAEIGSRSRSALPSLREASKNEDSALRDSAKKAIEKIENSSISK
jgi:HEAT repeat protein